MGAIKMELKGGGCWFVHEKKRGEGAFCLCVRKRGGMPVSSAFTLAIREACKGDGTGN